MEIVTTLFSFGVPGILLVFGVLFFCALFFDKIFESTFLPGRRRWAAVVGVLFIVIGVVLFLIGPLSPTNSGTARERELTATIAALQSTTVAQVAQITTLQSTATAEVARITTSATPTITASPTTPLPAPTSTPTPEPTITTDKVLSIESIPFQVRGWVTGKDMIAPKYFGNFSVLNGTDPERGYRLEFSSPVGKEGWAGIDFWFVEPQDLGEYDLIEVTLALGESETRCGFYIKDSSTGANGPYVDLGVEAASDIEVSAKGKTLTYRIPLRKHFESLKWKAIQGLGCSAWQTGQVEATHSFTISDIKFVKQ